MSSSEHKITLVQSRIKGAKPDLPPLKRGARLFASASALKRYLRLCRCPCPCPSSPVLLTLVLISLSTSTSTHRPSSIVPQLLVFFRQVCIDISSTCEHGGRSQNRQADISGSLGSLYFSMESRQAVGRRVVWWCRVHNHPHGQNGGGSFLPEE